MSHPAGALVAIGVGHVLLGDDAVGVRVIEHLRAEADADPATLPHDTWLVDGGTLGLDLLRMLRDARGAVVVDAMRLGAGAPGTVHVLDADAAIAAGSAPDGGTASAVSELLASARLLGWLPAQVRVVGIEIEAILPGAGLSPGVAAAVPVAAGAVRDVLRGMDQAPATGIDGDITTRSMAGATA